MGSVEQAVAALHAGDPVILPTDTVYGLCANPYREGPVAKVYLLKGRPEQVPAALLCANLDTVFDRVPELRGRVAVSVRAVLPGPYTLIVPNPARRFRWLNGLARDTIGIRVPVLAGDAREVLERVGAVTATSANRHKGMDPRRLDEIPVDIRAACVEIDGGELPGIPSTILDLTGREPRVVREGAGSVTEALERLAAVAA